MANTEKYYKIKHGLEAPTQDSIQVTESSRPTIRPSLSLDFANSKVLDPRITFARASTATYYDGKTVAKAEENLQLRSQEFDNAQWLKYNATITANVVAAPDGTTTTETLTATAGGSVTPYIAYAGSLPGAITVTASIFAKKNTHDFFQIWIWNGGTQSYANFNLATGIIGNAGIGVTNHVITSVDDGWYRCSFTFTTSNISASVGVGLIGNTTAARLQAFAATGTESVFIWGAQLEQRDSVTAYTPTTTQPITNYIPVLQTTTNDVARFDHDPVTSESLGLLIEEQRTNLVLRSEDFTDASWSKTQSTITANTIVAPDGTLTGDKLVEDTSNAEHRIYAYTTATGSAVYSIYLKAGEKTKAYLRTLNSTIGFGVDLLNGTTFALSTNSIPLPSSYGVSSVGNGWYRAWYAPNLTGSQYLITGSYSGALIQYTGNGFDGIYIWGAQLEAGSFPTSYIKTEASQVTRSADSASMTGANFSSWFRQNEGSFFIDSEKTPTVNGFYLLCGDATNYIRAFAQGSNDLQYFNVGSAPTISIANSSQYQKRAFAYKVNDIAASISASTVATGSPSQVPFVSQMLIGNSTGSINCINGTIKKLSYYPARLTNEQLQGLTSS